MLELHMFVNMSDFSAESGNFQRPEECFNFRVGTVSWLLRLDTLLSLICFINLFSVT